MGTSFTTYSQESFAPPPAIVDGLWLGGPETFWPFVASIYEQHWEGSSEQSTFNLPVRDDSIAICQSTFLLVGDPEVTLTSFW